MKIFEKLNFFGKKSDLKVPDAAVILLDEMVQMNPALFEAYKAYVYSKMTMLARKLINASESEVKVLQAKIKILDETIIDIQNINKFAGEEEGELDAKLKPADMLKKLIGIQKEKVASEKKKKYTIDDYLESKDFNGKLE